MKIITKPIAGKKKIHRYEEAPLFDNKYIWVDNAKKFHRKQGAPFLNPIIVRKYLSRFPFKDGGDNEALPIDKFLVDPNGFGKVEQLLNLYPDTESVMSEEELERHLREAFSIYQFDKPDMYETHKSLEDTELNDFKI